MARVTKKVFANVSLEAATQASEMYAESSTKLSKIEAKMNEDINKVKSKYQDEITELQEEIKEPYEILQAFAGEQKDKWGKKKSLDLLHCQIGFRTGMPKVEKDKKFTWDSVTELMKKSKLFKPFVRSKEEVNKEAIISCKDEQLIKSLKEHCYVFVSQDEAFFVDVKKEEVAA